MMTKKLPKNRKVPKRLRADRARIIVDCPANKIKEIASLLQWYASDKKIIMVSIASVGGVIEPKDQDKIRDVVNNVLMTKDAKDIDSLELAEEFAIEHPKARIIKKKEEIPYVG